MTPLNTADLGWALIVLGALNLGRKQVDKVLLKPQVGAHNYKQSTLLISGFRRDVDVICGLLGNYTASCGNYLPTFRDNVSVPSSSCVAAFQTYFSHFSPCRSTTYCDLASKPPATLSSYWPLSHRTAPHPALLPSFLVTSFLSI
jgi:hypothetical protein